MKPDEIAEDVPLDGEDKGVAAAFQPFEEIGAADALEPHASPGKILEYGRLGSIGGHGRVAVIAQAVARQFQTIKCLDHFGGKEAGVLIVSVFLLDLKFDGARNAGGKLGTPAIGEFEIFAAGGGIGFGVVLLDETAGAADKIKAHQIAPVVGVFAFFKGRQRAHGTLVAAGEFRFAKLAQQPLGPQADVLPLADEQAELIGKIKVRFVVRGGGEKNNFAFVGADVLGDGAVAFAVLSITHKFGGEIACHAVEMKGCRHGWRCICVYSGRRHGSLDQ
ncbi:MAG: hypothetical protein ACP5O1_12345 [Phycisphaerae bacterium]